ncbi:MAG: FtsX-like permease family protein [Candidatus Pacebacteria bacterium]|jgi:putative ABC transport system permease protein|nr:FtsX-like permease family protein [Candidatus Paceibacterota bacterium]
METTNNTTGQEPKNLDIDTGHSLSAWDLVKLSLRVFRTKPTRTLLTVLGMSVGIGTVVFLVSLGYGLQYILIGNLMTSEDSLMTLEAAYPSESGKGITPDKMNEISQRTAVDAVSPVTEFSGELSAAGGAPGIIPIIRVVRPSYFKFSGITPNLGDTFNDTIPGAILSAQALKLLGLTADVSMIGEEVTGKVSYPILSTGGNEDVLISKLKIIGIITDETEPPIAFIPYSAVAREPTVLKSLLIKVHNVGFVETLRDKLETEGFLISAKIDLVNQARKITNAITVVLMVFGTAALVVSAIGMFNTMIVGFLERIYEVGVMKSLGATDGDVRNLFLMESFLIGFLGGASGIILGIGSGAIINLIMSTLSQNLGSKALTLFITPTWLILATLALSSCIGLIAGYWPARNASKLSPREAFVRK